jgi:hypothetical protein
MRPAAPLVALSASLLLSGCIGLPSNWKPWGTPLDRQEDRAAKADTARAAVIGAAQESAHKTAAALSFAPPSRPVEIARGFAGETRTLLDQAAGAPKAGDAAQWQSLVERLLSENEAIRTQAERERVKDAEQVAKIADRLAAAEARADTATAKALDYARDNERLADMVRKFWWILIGLGALWVLSQMLTLAARFNPVLAPFATAANAIAAPALERARVRAVEGLQSVGRGLAEARKVAGQVTEQVIAHLDSNTDREHQRIIAAAANNSPTS